VPYFPLFINLEGLTCVIAGGGGVALRKAQVLLDFGASIRALDPRPSVAFTDLARNQGPRFSLICRTYQGPEDLSGAALALAASGDRALNRRFARDAAAAGIPVNAADDPGACGFFFPAIVRRGGLVAGISTSGLCPRFAARLREELERSWPASWDEALEKLAAERQNLRGSVSAAETVKALDERISGLLAGDRGEGESR
jgi:siroheme synthase-like protein